MVTEYWSNFRGFLPNDTGINEYLDIFDRDVIRLNETGRNEMKWGCLVNVGVLLPVHCLNVALTRRAAAAATTTVWTHQGGQIFLG